MMILCRCLRFLVIRKTSMIKCVPSEFAVLPSYWTAVCSNNVSSSSSAPINLEEAERKGKEMMDSLDYLIQDAEDIKTEVELIDETGVNLGLTSLAEAKTMARRRYLELIPAVEKTGPEPGDVTPLSYKLVTIDEYRHFRKNKNAPVKERVLKIKWIAEESDIDLKCKVIKKWSGKGQRVKVMWVTPNKTIVGYEETLIASQKLLIDRLGDYQVKSIDTREPPLNFVVLPKKKS